jgi:hypothetical protein
MNTIDLEKMKSDLREEISRVNDALRQILGEFESAKKELADLEAQLPRLLALFYLGKISKSELAKVKKRRSELREFLEEFPFLESGLNDQLKVINGKMVQVNATERQLKRYETLKVELEKGRNAYYENEFLGLAHELGCLDDARSFLNGVQTSPKQVSP